MMNRAKSAAWCRVGVMCWCVGMLWGCAEALEEPGAGQLQVTWRVLPAGCEGGGVEEVEVSLSDVEGEVVRVERFACGLSEGIVQEVPVGRYTVRAAGLSASGALVFESPDVRDVLVRAERAERLPGELELSAAPGEVFASWRFADGRVCGAHQVSEVRVVLFDAHDSLVAEGVFACNAGGGVIQGVPAGSYQVWGFAQGSSAMWQGEAPVMLERGSSASADVVLGAM